MTLLTGLAYPWAVTGLAQALFPWQANGSLIEENGTVIGSVLIGQNFTASGYFHPRPSAAGSGYDAGASSGSNYGVTSKALTEALTGRVAAEKQLNGSAAAIPADLVTASGSGLDPHITPEAALYQVPRIARVRNMSVPTLEALVARQTEGRTLAVLGMKRVNVLALNRELDKIGSGSSAP